MVQYNSFHLKAPDGVSIAVHCWHPGGQPKAAIQIAHGMAEHGLRYERFAEPLTAAGYVVYANDHRGHGQTALERQALGHFADDQGWERVLEDLAQLNRHIAVELPNLPIVFFGHSMGSFLGQSLIARHGRGWAGAILCASNGPPKGLASVGRYMAKMEKLRLGSHGKSDLLAKLSFGAFNKAFAPNRTDFDWLSRDSSEVDKYIADPLCGFPCSTTLWCDLLDALPSLSAPQAIARIPKTLPVLMIAGTRDPVSAGGKGLKPLLDLYHAAGIRDVELKLYEQARHELLNETNREEVTRDLLAWINRIVG